MIAFCTTCKGRTQHLEKTLPRNLADNDNCKFVLLDYASQDHLVDYLKRRHYDSIAIGKLVVYSFPTAGKFHMAHAKNMAHRCGMLERADVLCNLDADNFTCPSFADYIGEQFADAKDIFLWSRMIKGQFRRGISGRIVVRANDFLKVGGYDEKYDVWSPDDKDFNFRLRMLGLTPVEIEPKFLDAVSHNDKMRFKEYPHIRATADSSLIKVKPERTIVNFGNYGKGVVYRNFDFEKPIELGDVPTRIFGIGLHKTATSSLHQALKILGFDCAHWEDAHWAKAIWGQMKESGRSSMLEKHYALTDLPISILYEQLDKAYPGSKFILTVRDEVDWLRSVRDHWDFDKNPYRSQWSRDPFTHKMHKEVYGQKGFDSEIFLRRYRKHNSDVKRYFKGRPNDLLVLSKFDWPELCKFLERPIPAVAYPVEFVTGGKR